MRGRTRSWLLLVLVMLTTSWATAAEPLRYENAELHYSLTLPDGWVAMPQEVLAGRGFGGGARGVAVPVAAFQQPADSWFHIPALVITHMPGKDTRPQEIREDLNRNGGIGVNGTSMVFDEQRGTVGLMQHDTTSDGLAMDRLAVFKPTREGILHLDFYLPAGNLPAWSDPVVRGVLGSLAVDPDYAIQDLAPGEWPSAGELFRALSHRPLFLVGAALVLFGIVSGVVKRVRRA